MRRDFQFGIENVPVVGAMHQEAEVRIHPEALDHLREGVVTAPAEEAVATE